MLEDSWKTLRKKNQKIKRWKTGEEKIRKLEDQLGNLIGIPWRDIYGNRKEEIIKEAKKFPRATEHTFLGWKTLLSASKWKKKDLHRGTLLCSFRTSGLKRSSERRKNKIHSRSPIRIDSGSPQCEPHCISITWELGRNADSQVAPRPTETETLSVGLSNLCSKKPPTPSSDACCNLRNTGVEKQNGRWLLKLASLSVVIG